MSRPGRPRGSLGEISRQVVALAEAVGAIDAPMVAQRLQLSRRDASRAADNLRRAGYLVPAEPPAGRASQPGRPSVWLALPEVDLGPARALEGWLRGMG